MFDVNYGMRCPKDSEKPNSMERLDIIVEVVSKMSTEVYLIMENAFSTYVEELKEAWVEIELQNEEVQQKGKNIEEPIEGVNLAIPQSVMGNKMNL